MQPKKNPFETSLGALLTKAKKMKENDKNIIKKNYFLKKKNPKKDLLELAHIRYWVTEFGALWAETD